MMIKMPSTVIGMVMGQHDGFGNKSKSKTLKKNCKISCKGVFDKT